MKNRSEIEAIDNLIKNYPIDPNCIYVTGQSMGGVGTWGMIAALKAAGGNPNTEYPGVGHDSWKKAYATDEFWAWLYKQKLSDQ